VPNGQHAARPPLPQPEPTAANSTNTAASRMMRNQHAQLQLQLVALALTAIRTAGACDPNFYQPGDTPGTVPCEPCTGGREVWTSVLALSLCLFCVTAVWSMAKVSREWWPSGTDAGEDATCRVQRGAVFAGISLSHLQLVLLLFLLPVGWPDELAEIARELLPVALLDFGRLVPLECIMRHGEPSATFSAQLGISLATYIILNVPFALLYTIPSQRFRATNAMSILYSLSLPMLVRSCVLVVSCSVTEDADGGGSWHYRVDANPDMVCFEGNEQGFWPLWLLAMFTLLAVVVSTLTYARAAPCRPYQILSSPWLLEYHLTAASGFCGRHGRWAVRRC